ncbi:MAG: SulP family inorganic anion transporter [Opitutales bacterium]|nr:SulP family inorganic anion transporter [Opitutales bacterium]
MTETDSPKRPNRAKEEEGVLQNSLPLLRELHHYSRGKFGNDLVAGLTTGMVAVPVVLGYSLIAGLPPQILLNSAIMAMIFSALFISSRNVTSAPSTTICLLFASVVVTTGAENPQSVAILLALLVGLMTIGAGLVKLGNLTRFISRSVIVGFSTGVALLIIANQVSTLAQTYKPSQANFFELLISFVYEVAQGYFNLPALFIGIFTILVIIGLKRKMPRLPAPLVLVAFFGLLSALFHLQDRLGLRIVEDIGALESKLPAPDGLGAIAGSLGLIPQLITPALAIAILASLQNVSLAKNIGSRTGQRINPNQEMVGLGAGNFMAGLFGSMPNSGSFVLSGTNFNNRGKTQVACLLAGISLALIVLFAGQFANYIPIACLAGLLILAAASMISPEAIRISVFSTRSDATVFFVTLGSTLFFSLENAIFIGVGTSLVLFLKKAASPALVEYAFDDGGELRAVEDEKQRNNNQISIIHVEGELFFGASELFQDQIRRIANDQDIRVFILRLKNARHLDATAVFALQQLLEYLNKTNRFIIISGITPDVERVIINSGTADKIGRENIFQAENNPTMSTKRALMRAAHLLQTSSPDIRIFYDREKDKNKDQAEAEPSDDRPKDPEYVI